jgi:hypothetical protein
VWTSKWLALARQQSFLPSLTCAFTYCVLHSMDLHAACEPRVLLFHLSFDFLSLHVFYRPSSDVVHLLFDLSQVTFPRPSPSLLLPIVPHWMTPRLAAVVAVSVRNHSRLYVLGSLARPRPRCSVHRESPIAKLALFVPIDGTSSSTELSVTLNKNP